eukprot:TRINITY_DN33936_c1_g2_i1.p1 TRINITY_DN33936_c1_g2~~TRINITY_DN33936_c1_g2_i1.p1  ORF type:complete len:300 (+),score=28.18 TRINITY_DN33936_c1_g2_i1:146-1045(+)
MGASSSLSSPAEGVVDHVWCAMLACRYGSLRPFGSCRRVLYLGEQRDEKLPKDRQEYDIDEMPQLAKDCMRIVLISDTHERHAAYAVPPADLLIHCGDILASSRFAQEAHSLNVLRDFSSWLASTPCRHKVVVPGNHDIGITALGRERIAEVLGTAKYLEFETLELEVRPGGDADEKAPVALKVYGAPLSYGRSHNQACQGSEAEDTMKRTIPESADIVVTHGPPKGLIAEALEQIKPKLHAHGHQHKGYSQLRPLGNQSRFGATVNAAMMQPKGKLIGDRPDNLPLVLDLKLYPMEVN